MIGAFDTAIDPRFWSDEIDARRGAVEEAAITGSLIIEVVSVAVGEGSVTMKGRVRKNHLISRLKTTDLESSYLEIEAARIGHFHTSWSAVCKPKGVLGFVTFNFPSRYSVASMGVDATSGEDFVTVGLRLSREGRSLPPTTVGSHLCRVCGSPIAPERLEAVPGTGFCVECKKQIEKRRNK